MDAQHKQRLTGAVVVFALAVIFLPMMLSGPVERTRVDVPIDVPDEPEVEGASDLPPRDFLERAPPAAMPPDSPEPAPLPSNNAATGDKEATRAEESTAGKAAPPAPEPPPREAAAAEEGAASRSGSDSAAAGAGDDADGEWVVQVGAFGRRANAVGLRDRLKGADFSAFLEQAGSGDDAVYRVQIGPIAERRQATALAERLHREQQLEGIVLSAQ